MTKAIATAQATLGAGGVIARADGRAAPDSAPDLLRAGGRRHGWSARRSRGGLLVGQSVERLIEWTIGRSGRRGGSGQAHREPLLQSRDIHRRGSTLARGLTVTGQPEAFAGKDATC